MSVPTRMGTYLSATDAVRLKRGSTTTRRAPRFLASMAHLKPTGCASAGLPPITRMKSAFLMSTQLLVIAPRPKVAASDATDGAWHTRACASKQSRPSERATFWVMMPASLLEAEAARKPVVVQRLTTVPLALACTKLASRSAFISRAMRVSASSHEMRFQVSVPGSRTCGWRSRSLLWMKSMSPAPLGHSEPRLTG